MKPIVAAAFAAALLFASPLLAEEKPAQTVDMTVILLDEDGMPAKDAFHKEVVAPGQPDPDPKCAKCPSLTLGAAVAHALYASFPDERDITGDEKWLRGSLAQRLKGDARARLSAEEVTRIKKVLGKAYGPIVIMQAFPLIDPNAKPAGQ